MSRVVVVGERRGLRLGGRRPSRMPLGWMVQRKRQSVEIAWGKVPNDPRARAATGFGIDQRVAQLRGRFVKSGPRRVEQPSGIELSGDRVDQLTANRADARRAVSGGSKRSNLRGGDLGSNRCRLDRRGGRKQRRSHAFKDTVVGPAPSRGVDRDGSGLGTTVGGQHGTRRRSGGKVGITIELGRWRKVMPSSCRTTWSFDRQFGRQSAGNADEGEVITGVRVYPTCIRDI
jgi:hypothetical protein